MVSTVNAWSAASIMINKQYLELWSFEAMRLDPITALLDIGRTALDKFVADPQAKANALFKMQELADKKDSEQLQAQVQIILGQVEINKIEAASESTFKSGWRPAIGWTCAVSLFSYYVPYCLVATAIWAYQCVQTGSLVARPDLNIADLIGLVTAMLGVGVMRSIDKVTGK